MAGKEVGGGVLAPGNGANSRKHGQANTHKFQTFPFSGSKAKLVHALTEITEESERFYKMPQLQGNFIVFISWPQGGSQA